MIKVLTGYFCTAVLVAIYGAAYAQDVLYRNDGGKIECEIIDLTAQKIKYKIPQNPGPAYSMDAADALLAFNANGNYVVFPVAEANMQAAGFMNPPARKKFDVILTSDNQVIPAMNLTVSGNEARFTRSGGKSGKTQKLPRSKLSVILYRAGKYDFFVSPTKAAAMLKAAKPQVDKLTGVDNTLKKDMGKVNGADNVVAFPGGPEEFERFRNKALVKVNELGTYLATIADPQTPAERSNSTIDLAVTLFVNEDVRVEVSNVNTEIKKKYKIRDYLRRLKIKSADYNEVKIDYADISYATDFRRGPDGNYYGVVSFVQTFKGLVDGKIIYGDVTERKVTVILKLYEKAVEGQKKKLWDVFLADIGIQETRKL